MTVTFFKPKPKTENNTAPLENSHRTTNLTSQTDSIPKMMSVHNFCRSDGEILQELVHVFSSGRGTAREQWSAQAELIVEPVGWDALWKLSKQFCKKFEVRFPCIAYVTVSSVDFDALSACVEILSVQHEAVSLPETVKDVPLIELWPTTQQREQCINVDTTAEFIDLLCVQHEAVSLPETVEDVPLIELWLTTQQREQCINDATTAEFHYTNIWMPWDDQYDKVVLPNTIENRMRLWIDLHNGTIPKCVARSITLLRSSAVNAYETLKELDSFLYDEGLTDKDDSLLPPSYISLCAEMSARLDGLMSRWTLYENPVVREQYLAKARSKWSKHKAQNNVVALWQGGSIPEFEELFKFLRSRVSKDQTLIVMVSAEEGLAMEPEEMVVCSPSYEIPEMPLSQISLCSFKGATLKASEMRACLLMLSDDCRLRDLTLQCALANTVILMRAGTLHVVNCQLSDDSSSCQSDFAQGIMAMPGSKILVEDCTFENFYSGIVVHKGAKVELRNCTIRKCGVGIQLYSGSEVLLNGTTIAECSEQSVRCEVDRTAGRDFSSMKDLQIMPNCRIGSGDFKKEVLVVPQDDNLL